MNKRIKKGKNVTFNLPFWLIEKLDRQSEKEKRSKSNMLTVILESYFKKEKS